MAADPTEPRDEAPAPEERAPFFGTWARWYVLVLGTLAALIVLLSVVTRIYR